jgi:2-oxoisovalerate dehydrogenase E1 component
MGTSGIVGPCILQACGGGYSSKILKNGTVAVAFFGDGAANNGAFHEGLNMASIWKLPVLFVCENNQYATEVPFSYASSNESVASRAVNYSMSGYQLDGNDVLEIHRAAAEAVARARKGEAPACSNAKPTERERMPKGWATIHIELGKKSNSGNSVVRSLDFAATVQTTNAIASNPVRSIR